MSVVTPTQRQLHQNVGLSPHGREKSSGQALRSCRYEQMSRYRNELDVRGRRRQLEVLFRGAVALLQGGRSVVQATAGERTLSSLL